MSNKVTIYNPGDTPRVIDDYSIGGGEWRSVDLTFAVRNGIRNGDIVEIKDVDVAQVSEDDINPLAWSALQETGELEATKAPVDPPDNDGDKSGEVKDSAEPVKEPASKKARHKTESTHKTEIKED